jgi:hypothetical protein
MSSVRGIGVVLDRNGSWDRFYFRSRIPPPRIDAVAPTADAATAGCVTQGTLTSDFLALPSWSDLWQMPVTTTASAMVSGGMLRLAPSATAGDWAGMKSQASFAFRDRAFTIEAVAVTTDAVEFFGVDQGGAPSIRIGYEGGSVFAEIDHGPSNEGATITYNPVNHRYWRLAERSGITSLETSSDGSAFVVLYAAPTPVFASDVILSIGAGTNTNIASPGIALFDNVDDCGL